MFNKCGWKEFKHQPATYDEYETESVYWPTSHEANGEEYSFPEKCHYCGKETEIIEDFRGER